MDPVDGNDDLSASIAAYLAWLRSTLSRRSLFDLAALVEDRGISGGLNLLNLFIPPRAFREEEGPGGARDVLDLVASPVEPWIVVTGPAGAGKTTLSRWVALSLSMAGTLPLLDGMVPVRIELVEFDAAIQENEGLGFLLYLDHLHARRGLALRGEMLADLHAAGRLVWIFDGLDEVLDSVRRQRIGSQIAALRAESPSRGLITTRSSGVSCSPINLPRFHLLEWDDEQVALFVDRFYAQAFTTDPEVGAKRRDRLRRDLMAGDSLRELTRNPLLLTLLCLLNRGGELPRRRHQIYQRALELMLSQWEANKGRPAFEPEDAFAFLQDLARDLLDGSRPLTTTQLGITVFQERYYLQETALAEAALRFCQQTYRQTSVEASKTAAALLYHLRERAEVLVPVGDSGVGFVHKIFLEHLAAREIWSRYASHRLSEDGLRKLFRDRRRDRDWATPLSLLFGMLDEQGADLLIQLLQDAFQGVEGIGDWVWDPTEFALRCLAEVRHLDREPLRSFLAILAEVVEQSLALEAGNEDKVTHYLWWIATNLLLRPMQGRWPAGMEPRLPQRPQMPVAHPSNNLPPDADRDPFRSLFLWMTGVDIATDPKMLYLTHLLLGQDPENRVRREQLLHNIAVDPSATEEMRFAIAQIGTTMGPRNTAHDLFVQLARSATREEVRLVASMRIGDREAVEELAASATSEVVRRRASIALKLERLRLLLLQVGQLRRAVVCIAGERVGFIEETRDGSRFGYDDEWLSRPDARPISPTLPLRSEPYESEGLHPFFDNLLPEGWLLDLKGRRLKLDPSDTFGLLLASGDDLIGAVDVRPEPT